MTQVRTLPSSDTFHGLRKGDRVVIGGRRGTVDYVGMEPYMREFGMKVVYDDGKERFFLWNSMTDSTAVERALRVVAWQVGPANVRNGQIRTSKRHLASLNARITICGSKVALPSRQVTPNEHWTDGDCQRCHKIAGVK
jgi:hypothetical protein